MRTTYLSFGEPLIGEAEICEVEATLRSGWIGTGPKVARFEEMFREYTGAAHAVATSSGTAALHLALLVAGIGPGDAVITTPLTFCATVNAILYTGARPVFCDVDPHTRNLDPKLVSEAITSRTRAILPVHLGGRPCDLPSLRAIARDNDCYLIEDGAHAVGASLRGQRIGAGADAACFSFYATKNLTTIEGGMITTPHEKWAQRAKCLGRHGMQLDAWERFSSGSARHSPQMVVPGYKYNMTDVQASLGIHQLARLEAHALRRREIWASFAEAFKDLPLILPAPEEPYSEHARHLYSVLIDEESAGKTRDQVRRELHERNIGTGIHFTALHLHRGYQELLGVKRGDFPNSEFISDRTLSLPLSPKLSDADVDDVTSALRKVISSGSN